MSVMNFDAHLAAVAQSLEWVDVGPLIVIGVGEREATALLVAMITGGRARGAELAASLQVAVDGQRARVERPS
ncbi:MAG TPA: hypothetical protein VGM56_08725 [Byssovorax sp.]